MFLGNRLTSKFNTLYFLQAAPSEFLLPVRVFLPLLDDGALHGFAVELSVVVDLDGPDGVAPLDKHDLALPGADNLRPLERPDVAEQFEDVLLRHRRLQVRHHDLGALQRAHVRGLGSAVESTLKAIL